MTVAASSGLERIEHLVVLMLENRSFDHMLGYLSLEGGRDEVDGLRRGMANDHAGERNPIHHLPATYLPDERWDPEHQAGVGPATPVCERGAADVLGWAPVVIEQ